MASSLCVSVFCEDRAHEEFIRPFVTRIAAEESCRVSVAIRAASGGSGRALVEFAIFQQLCIALKEPTPDITVVAIDGNCVGHTKKRKEIMNAVRDDYLTRAIVAACPNPHIERWYVADPASCARVLGSEPLLGSTKCVRSYYKNVLASAVRQGGSPPTLGGIEFARELVADMDLYTAGKSEPGLGAFTTALRSAVRTLMR